MRDISRGNLAVAQQHATIQKKIFDQTYGPGANPALVGVAPNLRVQASANAQKAANEYRTASGAMETMGTFIDLAKKGNRAAGANLPVVGAETLQALNGIKRINKTEIENYAGAGSLLDKIQGRVGKLVSGQPIPADVLKDIEDLHKTLFENAAKNYNSKITDINHNYNSNFTPVEGPKTSGSGGGGGKAYTQADVDAAVKAHPGTNAQQIEAAFKSKGWTKQ